MRSFETALRASLGRAFYKIKTVRPEVCSARLEGLSFGVEKSPLFIGKQ